MTKRTYAIAIDGPGGAGKSTIARRLASAMHYVYVDTGAIYRTVGYYMNFLGIGPKDIDGITRLLPDVNLDLTYDQAGVQHVILNGQDVSSEIRTPAMSKLASAVSAHAVVRDFLLDVQRDMARKYNVIMDGRDIGTVVLPDADVKIFLTASPEIRAKRRYEELLGRGTKTTYQQVLQELEARDLADTQREVAPLKQADDAILVDTSQLTLEQVVTKLQEIIQENIKL